MNNLQTKFRLSGDKLKIIAAFFMLIDHVSFGLLMYYMNVHYMDILPHTYTKLNNIYNAGRCIGGIAFPIFCFFIVEGFCKTSNITRYSLRLLIFGLIAEIPFDLGLRHTPFYWEHQNTILTLFFGVLMLIVMKYVIDQISGLSTYLKVLCYVCDILFFCELTSLLKTDYSFKGIILIATLYLLRDNKILQLLCGGALVSYRQFSPVAFLLLLFYDPEEKPKHKYFFYIFYPTHFLIIYLISLFL